MKNRLHWILLVVVIALAGYGAKIGRGLPADSRSGPAVVNLSVEDEVKHATDIAALRKAVRQQQDEVEASRIVLAAVIRNDNARQCEEWHDVMDGRSSGDAAHRRTLIDRVRTLAQRMNQLTPQIDSNDYEKARDEMADDRYQVAKTKYQAETYKLKVMEANLHSFTDAHEGKATSELSRQDREIFR